MAMMKLSTALLLLLPTIVVSTVEANRTQIDVEFEYQLEVADLMRTESTKDVLDMITGEILVDLQSQVPQNMEGGNFPIVKFANIESEIFSACFTDNDQCSLVRSTIKVTYAGDKPEHSVEFVTLKMVQDYLDDNTDDENQVKASYTYPSIVSSLARFQMHTVVDRMTEVEIKVVEETFEQVFGATLFAIERDTEVVDAKFLYQDLLDQTSDMSDSELVLSTDLQIAGFCRECTSEEFEEIVVSVININVPVFQKKLKVNSNNVGSTYFDNVSGILFSVPVLPVQLPPIVDESIFDEESPAVDNKQPLFLWFGLSIAICVIGIGGFMIAKNRREYEKDEDISTGESESEDESDFVSEVYFVSEVEEGPREDRTHEVGTYDDLDGYQVETITRPSFYCQFWQLRWVPLVAKILPTC